MQFHKRRGISSSVIRRLRRATFEVLERRQLLAAHIVGSSSVYSTIQSAVDAATPGATITVDPGQYNEMVTVNKMLTIRGAAAGIDARSNLRYGAPESVMNGALNATDGTRSASFYIAADDVTIDGFTVQSETSQSVYSGAGIVIAPKISGTHIFNNIVQNNVAGVFLANYNDAKAAVIYHNLFRDNNNPGLDGGRAIYTDGGVSGGNLSNVIIDSNAFIRNFGSTGTTTVEAAVAFEGTGVPQTNIRITNNVFDTNGKAVLFFHSSNVTIQNNLVTYSKDQWSAALRFEGDNHDFTIQGNTLVKNTGPAIRIDNKGIAGDNYNFSINQNNFYENGMYSGSPEAIEMQPLQYVGTLNAQNNWYNSNNGPGGSGPGSGELIVTNGIPVDFTNWSTTRFAPAVISFMGAPWAIDQMIQAEDFDQGSEGYGYHDTEYTNFGTATSYRFPTGVDLENTGDTGGGYNVGYIKTGEWLDYTVNIAQAGLYNLAVRVASDTQGGNFHFELDGANITGTMTIPNTGAWQTYTTITKNGINLPAGVHTLRLVNDSQGASSGATGNYNWFKFTFAGSVPTGPGNLVAQAPSTSAANLSWMDNSTIETNYIVERQAGISGVWQVIQTLPADSTSYTDNTVSAGNFYIYRVRAINANGSSIASNEAAVSVPATTPVSYLSDMAMASSTNGWGPVEIDTSNGGQNAGDGNTITLNGITYSKGLGVHAISDVVYNLNGAYNTFQSDIGLDDETGPGSVVFQVFADNVKIYDSGVMFQDSPTQSLKLNIAGAQQLRLHVDDAGDGNSYDHADWAGARVSFEGAPALATPIGVTASGASPTQIIISWTDVFGETGYRIERSLDGASGWTSVGTTPADTTTFADNSVSGSGLFYYRVIATGDSIESQPSSVVSATVLMPPAAPANLSATPASTSSISLTWSDVAGESGFKVERSNDGVSGWTQIGTTPANITTYTDSSGLSAGTTYYYQVRATNAAGDSAYSSVASATTLNITVPAAPSNLAAVATSTTQVNLTWTDNSNNETGFVVERSSNGVDGWTQIATRSANVTSYSDASLAANTKYYYRVRATSLAGDSLNSGVASATTFSINGLPAGWSDGDIGAVNAKGSTSYSNGIFTMITGGSDIWNNADTEHFTYQTLTGDGTFIAHVISMQNTNSWSNAGIQMRDTLAANSRQVSAVVTPVNGVVMTDRTAVGATTDGVFVNGGAPVWFKIVRSGSTFTTYQSDTGTNWTLIGSVSCTMGSTIYVGLVGTAKNTTTTNTIKFDNVSLQPVNVVTTAPAAPSNLLAQATSSTQINLTWSDNSDNETGFIVERSTDGVNFSPIVTLAANTTSYNNTGLAASTLYFYRVRATNSIGDSANSTIASATTPAAPVAPSAPTGVVATAVSWSQINLTWSDVSGETGYKIERSTDGVNFTQIAAPGANVVSFADTALSASTKYYYRIRATNAGGDSAYSTIVNATTQSAPSNGLPAGWTDSDIGVVNAKGSVTYSNGTYTMVSGGSDIWNNSDTFNFAYTTLTGDGTIIARVTSMQNTNSWANAGIQIRNSLDANSTEASLVVTPVNGVVMTSRTTTGGTTDGIFVNGGAPEWMKLVRQGTTITSYKSNDGITWTLVGSVNISMGSTVYVGLVGTAKNVSTTNTIKFDNVSVTNSIV